MQCASAAKHEREMRFEACGECEMDGDESGIERRRTWNGRTEAAHRKWRKKSDWAEDDDEVDERAMVAVRRRQEQQPGKVQCE